MIARAAGCGGAGDASRRKYGNSASWGSRQVSPRTKVGYARGCDVRDRLTAGFPEAVALAPGIRRETRVVGEIR